MIAHTQNGEVVQIRAGELPNGVAFVKVEIDARDTAHPEFLDWFAEHITPRMTERRKPRK